VGLFDLSHPPLPSDLPLPRGATTLDRVQTAMPLQAAGPTNALRALVPVEGGLEFLEGSLWRRGDEGELGVILDYDGQGGLVSLAILDASRRVTEAQRVK
jgi:hypothetical protein